MGDEEIKLASTAQEQTDIKHGFHEEETSRGGRADKSFLLKGRRKESIRGRLETCCPFQGRLGSNWPGRHRPARKIPTPACNIKEKSRVYHEELSNKVTVHGQVSRSRKKDPQCEDLHAMQCAQPNKSNSLPQVRL
jgi:hypothetical protein